MIPQPKYDIGDTVYCASTRNAQHTLPCPDCLDTKKWKVITPGGDTLEADCARCIGRYSYSDIPSLDYLKHVGSVSKLTIGSIRIDTDRKPRSWPHSGPVQYMCVETGVGSGNLYNEEQLWREEHEAQADAEQMAAEANAKAAPKQPTPLQWHIGSLRIVDAHIDMAKAHIWRARSVANNINAILNEEPGDEDYVPDDELREKIANSIESEVRWMEQHLVSEGIPSVTL